MNGLRAVLVEPEPAARVASRHLLAAVPSVVVVGEFADVAVAAREAAGRRPDVAFVGVGGPDAGDAAGAVGGLSRALPDAAIVAIGDAGSADFVLGLIRAGAVEFLRRPVERAHLLAALEKVARFRRPAAPPPPAGRVTAVFAAKGGLGATTVATNLAVCLARSGVATLLVELDGRASEVATFLDLKPAYSILDALGSVDRMDESLLRGLLTRHPSGLWVLPGPAEVEPAALPGEPARACLEIARAHFEHLVIDLRHGWDPATVAALTASDTVLFLTSLNVAALRAGAAGLAAFERLGIERAALRLVLMREGGTEDVGVQQARDLLGLDVAWKVPNDYAAAVAAINGGQPVVTAAPRTRLARSLAELARAISGEPRGGTAAASHSHAPAVRPGGALSLRPAWMPRRLLGAR